jgi:hypothetical protein
LIGYMQQLSCAVHDELPSRSRWWPVSFHPSLNISALTLKRQDGDASGFPLILLTLPLSGRQSAVGEDER